MSGTAAASFESAPVWKPVYSPWLIAFVVTMATFMEVLDTTIVNVSLPHIAGNLSATVDESTWVLTSYLVSNAIVLPISAWMSSLLGRKRFYMTCVALFTISSMLCGLAQSLPMLLTCRVLQGLGGGGLQPSEQAILVDTFPRERRGAAFAITGIAMVAAPALGPTLGGWITDNFNWRWVFFINVPIGVLSLLLTSAMIQDPPTSKRLSLKEGATIDYIGLGLIVLALGSLQIVLDQGQRLDWYASDFIRVFSVLAVAGLIAALVWEVRHKHPVLDLSLFRDRNFALAATLMFFMGSILFGATVLLPLLLQTVMGYSAMQAGLVLSPGALVIMIVLPIMAMIIGRIQPRWLIAIGFTITSVAFYAMSRLSLDADFMQFVMLRCFQMFGVAFIFVPINTAAYSYIPSEKNNTASSIINLTKNIGASIGIALATTFLAQRAQFHQSVLVGHATRLNASFRESMRVVSHRMSAGLAPDIANAGALGAFYRVVLRQASMLAYIDCFVVFAAACLLVVPLALALKSTRRGAKAAAGH